MTLPDVTRLYSDDAQCRELLKRLRWPNGPECPRCHDTHISTLKGYARFECVACQYQFTVTSGTIFHDSHLPLPTWFLAVLLIVEAKKGMSAMQLKRTLWGLDKGSYKTAWYLCHRIRAAMAGAEKQMLDGTIEMDETYVGGKQHSGKGWNTAESNKEIVIGLRKRGGDLRFFHAVDVKSGTLAKYIQENISADLDLMVTDEMPAYPKAMIAAGVHGSKHKTIRHRDKVYVDGDIHTNTVESAFSLLKRGIMGSWHKISAKHLPAYLEEMTFRFNRRRNRNLFVDTLQHMVTVDPLTFEKLTA